MSLKQKIKLLKDIEKYIYFDGLLNILLLLLGFKYVSKLENIKNSNINESKSFFKKLGLYYFHKGSNIYVSRKNIDLEKIDNINNNIYLGKLLGFPLCCCKSFGSIGISKENYFDYFININLQNNKGKYKILTFFNGDGKLIFHIPCSFSCEDSFKKAKIIYNNYNLISNYKHNLKFNKYIILEDLIYIRLLDEQIITYGTLISGIEEKIFIKYLNESKYVKTNEDYLYFTGNNNYEYKKKFVIFYFDN